MSRAAEFTESHWVAARSAFDGPGNIDTRDAKIRTGRQRLPASAGRVVVRRAWLAQLNQIGARGQRPRAAELRAPGKVDSYGAELRDFSLAVLEGKPLDAAPEYFLGELRTALAMYRSAESRRWEKVWR